MKPTPHTPLPALLLAACLLAGCTAAAAEAQHRVEPQAASTALAQAAENAKPQTAEQAQPTAEPAEDELPPTWWEYVADEDAWMEVYEQDGVIYTVFDRQPIRQAGEATATQPPQTTPAPEADPPLTWMELYPGADYYVEVYDNNGVICLVDTGEPLPTA